MDERRSIKMRCCTKGGTRPGAGRKSLRRNHAEKEAAKGIYIGAENVRKWISLRHQLQFMNDSDFAVFLLQLAENLKEPRASLQHTESEQQQTTDASSNSNNNNNYNNNNTNSNSSNKSKLTTTDAITPSSTIINPSASKQEAKINSICETSTLATDTNSDAAIQIVDEKEQLGNNGENDNEEEEDDDKEDEKEADGIRGDEPEKEVVNANHIQTKRKKHERILDEENDSPSEDEKDYDWTPAGIRARCMRRSTRTATFKSRQGGRRQTRARARILTPQPAKRKTSSSGDIRKAPYDWLIPSPSESDLGSLDETPGKTEVGAEKVRPCIDCGQKHQAGGCALQRPLRVISDEQAVAKDDYQVNRAEISLPKMLKLVTVDVEHGPSVFTMEALEPYTQFGPLVGQIIDEADIHEDMDLKNIWEIFHENIKFYLDTSNPNDSNWTRYLRPAPSKDERTLSAVCFQDSLYFVTVKGVPAGTELTYWSEDPTVTWSKKKVEKTSCGGCNQKFVHPLYYRMHCMIFHDPNYSLTIRKYHCKICGIAVLGKENIMKHASEMHDGKGAYQCQYCKKFFLRLNYLDMHRTYGCKLNPRRSRPLCDLCGKKFCQPQKLKVHIRRMHSDISEVLKEFQCKSCFKLLGSRAALQRHLKEVHNKDQNIAATCDRCGKTFQNKSNLKIHMLTHSGVKPFRCTENGCTAAFTTKQCLQFHYKKVHGYTMESMPSIERCIAYTFESYSGSQGDCEDCGDVPANGDGVHSMVFVNPDSIPSMTSASDLDSSSMCSSNLTAFPNKEGVLIQPAAVPVQAVASVDSLDGDNNEMDDLEALTLEPCHVANVQAEQQHSSIDREFVEEASPLPPEAPESRPEEKDIQLESVRDEEPEEDSLDDVQLPSHPLPQVEVMSMEGEPAVSADPGGVEEDDSDGGRKVNVFDQDVERMDSSDVDLNTDLDDNISERSLELDPRDNASPRQQQSIRSVEHMVEAECSPHMSVGPLSYGSMGGRLLCKEDPKEYSNEMAASMACDFAIVRHYAASLSAQQQSDYAMQLRHHMEAGSTCGAMEQLERQDDEGMGPSDSGAEDLTRYEIERNNDVSIVKVESSDDLSDMCEDLTKRRLTPDDPDDLLVVPDDDEDEDAPSPRDDASLVLAQHEHSINQFLRHQAALSSQRDLDRLPMHSLDLSLPRTTVHLLEHLARTTTTHSVEHMTSRQMSSSPEDANTEHLPRQLSFHGMESLPRPLPHRLDHLSHGMDHMARSPSSQQEGDSVSHGIEHLTRQATSHPLDGISQGHVPYVVDHLSRLPPPSHAMDTYARGSMEALSRPPTHSMDNLSRATAAGHGMEFLSRLSPLPRTHRLEAMARTFTYSMEHADAYLLQHGGATDHLSRPPSHASQYASEQRATPHSLDLSTSRNVDSPQSQHDGGGGGNGRAVSPPSYQECSPPTPSSSSSSYQAVAATSSSSSTSSSHPPPPSPVPTSSVHSNYPTYLEYY